MTVRMQKGVSYKDGESFWHTCFLQLNFTLVSLILGNAYGVFAHLLSLPLGEGTRRPTQPRLT